RPERGNVAGHRGSGTCFAVCHAARLFRRRAASAARAVGSRCRLLADRGSGLCSGLRSPSPRPLVGGAKAVPITLLTQQEVLMNPNDRRFGAVQSSQVGYEIDESLRQHMLRVYYYMAAGLVITGVVAYIIGSVPALYVPIFSTPLKWVV